MGLRVLVLFPGWRAILLGESDPVRVKCPAEEHNITTWLETGVQRANHKTTVFYL